ncbi:hypothetical protein [Nitrosomonas sp.]|uniref:hypothetical protein n=1 Tax=Nitrosomonas sp. TaxID=42353 RepID=UPI0025E38366|nr:hypothetical protein [Nitrosomonas sp.]MCC6916891.1 hypothetical protein [Nitrosomonas sp.]
MITSSEFRAEGCPDRLIKEAGARLAIAGDTEGCRYRFAGNGNTKEMNIVPGPVVTASYTGRVRE